MVTKIVDDSFRLTVPSIACCDTLRESTLLSRFETAFINGLSSTRFSCFLLG